ncbi:T9SS type B sorting domain-containing protein, partial [Flavobacteriaceae bacterium]|nr:T9SS type B sorting domain-containing protein [Flavobacteriaceae bacterium]
SNSIWFRFKAARSGELGFNIIPNNTVDDWDFAVYGPDVSCNDLGDPFGYEPPNCGISNYLGGGGSTGAGTPRPGREAHYTDFLNINEGEEFYLLINSFRGGNDTFTLQWTGSLVNDGLGNPLDCSIVVGDLGPDQEVCEGEIIELDGTSPATTAIGYQWSLNTGAGFSELTGETNPTYIIDNDVSGTYKVEVTDQDGSTDDDEVEINFYSQPTITPLPNPLYEVFDEDGTEDGFTIFNLRDLFDSILLGSGQLPATYEVVYYSSQADADANVSPIPNPENYTNTPDNPADSTDEIFARVVTIDSPNTCNPATTSFKLLVKINQPPVLFADFREAYCPLSKIKIAKNFTITDPDDTGLDFFTIQISEGYSNPNDLLELTGTHPTVTARPFDITEGKLILEPTAPATEILYADLEAAVREIIFTSTDPNISGERSFSFTIGDANYLPLTGHFYEFISELDITWQQARTEAESKTYYGLKGYLATILSEEENQICAEQIIGQGWIGANDENNEGDWRWVTGPEGLEDGGNGLNFWNGGGQFDAGNPVIGMYANWNNCVNPGPIPGDPAIEPNDCCRDDIDGQENYAHITSNQIGCLGTWNDLANVTSTSGNFQSKGYVIEYGGFSDDIPLNISASTSIYIPQITNFDPVKRNCTGGTMTFTATASEGEIYWYDAPTGGNLVETGDTFTTPSLTSSKTYYVSASPEGCATTQRIAVDAIIDTTPVVIATQFDINRCDENRAGFLNFDLQADQTPIILAGLDPILNPRPNDFIVLYFDNLLDAEANTTANIIANPYRVNTSPIPTTIYARIHNSINTTCYTTVEFKIKVTDTPILTQPLDYRICDDTASAGGDTDGVSSFLLNRIDDEILIADTNSGEYTISYHTDSIDAQTSSTTNAIPKDTDYQVTTSQTVYVRIENNNDPFLCYTVSDDSPGSTFKSFKLIVDPLPVVNTGVEIDYCIVIGDPNPTVDLTQAEASISSTTGATFEYFKDLAGTDLILDPVSYPPVGNVLQSVYVKVISDQGCARDLVELVLNIGETPNNSFNDLVAKECDDFLDPDGNDTPGMNDDTDNITNFSLDLTAIRTAINPPINTDVFFYENTSDRNSNSNNILDLTNYRNNPANIDISIVPDGIQFPIYYKILSIINNDCEGIGQFYLQIDQVPLNSSNTLPPIVECDNAIWDGDFTNGSNDRIDLTQIIGTSAGQIFEGTGQVVADFDFSFFTSEAGALSGDITSTDYINTPTQFTNSVPTGFVIGDVVTQTIYVRVKNIDTQCINPHTSFDVIINPAPITTIPILPVEVCDIGAQDGDTGNGYAQNIDISGTDFYVSDGRPATDVIITYHKNLIDLADLTSDGVDKTDYDSDPTRVTIDPVTKISEEILYIRIIDISSPSRCVFDQSTVTIIVYPEPTTEIIPNQSYCDDDSDGVDTNGIVQNINLDGLIPDILGLLQPIGDFNVTFHADPLDLPDGTNALTTPHENISSPNQQRIYVRVENKDTGCVNDDLFFDVIVNPLPKFKVTSPQIVCLSGPPLTLFIENPDTRYDYVWTAPNGNEFTDVDEITIESGGLYTVTATTTNGTDCSRTREIQVNESIRATITDDDVTIVDDSDNNSITIDPTNLGIGDYQYALIDENGVQTAFQDIPVFENLAGGFYTIVVQDKNGCRPDANLVVSVIEYPKFFTPNNDGINDTWAIKGANSTFYPNAQIYIFNRFGKVVAQIDVDNPGWDGTYGGKILSSDDYWFSIMMVDRNGNARERKGNFSLLRR